MIASKERMSTLNLVPVVLHVGACKAASHLQLEHNRIHNLALTDTILGMQAAWIAKGSQIESARIVGKTIVAAQTTNAAVIRACLIATGILAAL